MRPVRVVPVDVQRQLPLKSSGTVGDQESSCALVLQGADHSLDDRDTAVLANGPESLPDAPSLAPASESPVSKLLTLVGDQVTGSRTRLLNDSSRNCLTATDVGCCSKTAKPITRRE